MLIYSRFDEAGQSVGAHLNGAAFDREVEWSNALLEQADGRFLRVEGDIITLSIDDGTATYRITSRDDRRGTVHSVLEGVS